MRLSTVCVVALGVVFLSGVLPGCYGQAEIAQPGLQVVERESSYNVAISIHALVFAGLLPLVGIALTLAVIAEVRASKAARAGAISVLAGAPLAAVAMFVVSARRIDAPGLSLTALSVPDLLMLVQAIGGFVVLVLLAVLGAGRRAAAVIFALLSGIALLLSSVFHLVLANSGIDHALHDTYYILGAEHLAGVSIALNILGALTVWSMRWQGMRRTVFSVVAGIGVLATGGLYSMEAGGLGLMGMPLRYVDYTPAFAAPHAVHAAYAVAFSVTLAVAIAWLAIITWRSKPPPGVETAFE